MKTTDEILFNHFVNRKKALEALIDDADAFSKELQAIVNELFALSAQYWKLKINADTPHGEVYVLIKRSFNYWHLFVKRLEKEGMNSYAKLFEGDADIEKFYMKDAEFKKIWDIIKPNYGQ